MSGDKQKLSVKETFIQNQETYARLQREVEYILEDGFADSPAKVHSITGRVKNLGSFLEKIDIKGYYDPFAQVEDIVGCRVVCLFIDDLDVLKSSLHSMFEIVAEENKVDKADQDRFGYMSVHYICRLKTNYGGPRYAGLHKYKFEIQCRTILMDAWANVSHYLDYKGETSIPTQLKRDFYALSGLFYVADKQFQQFYDKAQVSRKEAATQVNKASRVDEIEVPINLDTMIAYLFRKYPDRDENSPNLISLFVEELGIMGYKTIGDFDKDLSQAEREALRREKAHPPGGRARHYELEVDNWNSCDQKGISEPPRRYTRLHFAREALAIINPEYAKYKRANPYKPDMGMIGLRLENRRRGD